MTAFEEQFKNNKWLIFSIVIAIFATLKIVDTLYRPFWFDELFTWHIAQMPTITGLWQALGPMDPSPPLYYILTRLSQSVFGYGELATRLPALISFLAALFFLFLILDKRCGAITAITGVLLLCITPAALLIANARTYTFILALCTISLWCWQEAAAGPRRVVPLIGLFLSLSMALYSHFYAFLIFTPIVTGELYRSFKIKKIDWPIWLCLLSAAATIIPLIPLAERCTSLSKGFWSKPTLAISIRSSFLYASTIIGALIAFIISSLFNRFRKVNIIGASSEIALTPMQHPAGHEVVAAISLAFIPFLGFIVAICFTNAFTARYFESAAIGAIIALAYCKHLIKRPWVIEGTLLMIITAFLCVAFQVYLLLPAIESNRNLKSRISNMLNTGDNLPIVMLDSLQFLQTQHYAPKQLKERLVYLIDYDSHFNYEKNSVDISLAGLAKYELINVFNFQTFIKAQKAFYIAQNSPPYILRSKKVVAPSEVTTIIHDKNASIKDLIKVEVKQ